MVIRTTDYVEERMPGPAAAGREYSRELSPAAVYRQDGYAVVGSSGLLRQERAELRTHTRAHYEKRGRADANALLGEAGVSTDDDREFYRLTEEHAYYVEFEQELSVPDGHVGLVVSQENLLRAGVMTHADPVGPNETTAEALLHVEASHVLVDHEASIAEMVVVEVESTEETPSDDPG